MAYTFPWNNAIPAGSDAASSLDTFITDLKNALTERFEAFIVQSMTADPWILKPNLIGSIDIANKRPFFLGPDFLAKDTNSPWTYANDQDGYNEFITSISGTGILRGNLLIPVGYKLQQVDFICDRNGRAGTFELIGTDLITGVNSSIATVALAGAGIQINSLLALNVSISSLVSYRLKLLCGAVASGVIMKIYGVRYYITKDDNSQGL